MSQAEIPINELIPTLLIAVTLLWALAALINVLLGKIKLPNILGELLAGLLLSCIFSVTQTNFSFDLPFGLSIFFNWLKDITAFIHDSETLSVLGEIGIILLLFEVGLETELDQMLGVGKEALLVALGGVIAPFGFAWVLSWYFNGLSNPALHWDLNLTLFVGLVLAATSIGVTARVFGDLKLLHLKEARIILGAAVIDDVIGLILLSVISALVSSSGVSLPVVAFTILKALLFLGGTTFLGRAIANKLLPWLNQLSKSEPLSLLIWVLSFGFIFAYLAHVAGLAPIVGAFAAGLALDTVKVNGLFGETKSIEDFTSPIRAILAPIFFVKVGLAINPLAVFGSLALILTLLACFSKLLAGWLLMPLKTSCNRFMIGLGMMPRGEVGLVVAALGHQMGILKGELYSAILVAVIMTTLIAPICLQILLKNSSKESFQKSIEN